jgi:hypothetical protein
MIALKHAYYVRRNTIQFQDVHSPTTISTTLYVCIVGVHSSKCSAIARSAPAVPSTRQHSPPRARIPVAVLAVAAPPVPKSAAAARKSAAPPVPKAATSAKLHRHASNARSLRREDAAEHSCNGAQIRRAPSALIALNLVADAALLCPALIAPRRWLDSSPLPTLIPTKTLNSRYMEAAATSSSSAQHHEATG